jgi:hypothetical protein
VQETCLAGDAAAFALLLIREVHSTGQAQQPIDVMRADRAESRLDRTVLRLDPLHRLGCQWLASDHPQRLNAVAAIDDDAGRHLGIVGQQFHQPMQPGAFIDERKGLIHRVDVSVPADGCDHAGFRWLGSA